MNGRHDERFFPGKKANIAALFQGFADAVRREKIGLACRMNESVIR